MQKLPRLLFVFETVVFSWFDVILRVIAFFIVVITDYFESISFGPRCCINTSNKSIEICFFLGLVLTMVVLSIFLILFIKSLNGNLETQKLIGRLKSLRSYGLLGFWGSVLGFIWFFDLDIASFGINWANFTLIILVNITYSKKKLQNGYGLCPHYFCNLFIPTIKFSSLFIYLTFHRRPKFFIKVPSKVVY